MSETAEEKGGARWSWFREPGYHVGGMYGRPWALMLQWSRGRYVNIDVAAPALGDCRIGWTSKSWARESLRYGFSGSVGWDCSRMSWAEMDAIEAHARDVPAAKIGEGRQ